MSTYLCVKANNTTKKYEVKASANKPYVKVSTGYMPLTTQTDTNTGLRFKQGGSVYRVIETYTTTISVDTSSTNTYTYTTTRQSQYQTYSTSKKTTAYKTTTAVNGASIRFSGRDNNFAGGAIKYKAGYTPVVTFSRIEAMRSYTVNTTISSARDEVFALVFPMAITLSNNSTRSLCRDYDLLHGYYTSWSNASGFSMYGVSSKEAAASALFTAYINYWASTGQSALTASDTVYYNTTRESQYQTNDKTSTSYYTTESTVTSG